MNIYDIKRQIGRPTDWLTSTYWPVVLLTWLFIPLMCTECCHVRKNLSMCHEASFNILSLTFNSYS